MIEILKGETLPKTAKSLFFYKKGKAKIAQVITPFDILQKGGRWNVAVKSLVVGLCPSDMAGGMLEFPPSSTRSLSDPKSPAVAGHEFVGQVTGGTKEGMKELAKRGIKLGDIIVGDINVGCGFCVQCKRGDPAVYCANGATFAGVGTSPAGVSWVRKQTGRAHVPGAYTQGFIVLPSDRIHKVPKSALKTMNALALFSQSDSVACSMTSCNTMGFTTFKTTRGFDNPTVLIIGAGRLGMWHVAVIKDILPKTKIFIADIKKENLASVSKLFGIPKSHQYLVKGNNAFSRKRIEDAFGKGILFDFVIDTAGHGVLSGNIVTELLLSSVAQGGKFWTTSHTGISGVDAGHPMLLLGSKSFGNGLSPQNNFPYAVSFLAKHWKKYVRCIAKIPKGLANKELADIVATGGSEYKKKVSGITFYSVLWENIL